MNSNDLGDQTTLRYFLVFVPEVGQPRSFHYETEDELKTHLSAPRGDPGWFYCFYGYSLPLAPGGAGFYTPTGRYVAVGDKPPQPVQEDGGTFLRSTVSPEEISRVVTS